MVESAYTMESSESAIANPKNGSEQHLFQSSTADANTAQAVRSEELTRINQTSGSLLPEISIFDSKEPADAPPVIGKDKGQKEPTDAPPVIGKDEDKELGDSYKTPNGTQVEVFQNGTIMVATPDGKMRMIDSNGRVFERGSDGSAVEVKDSGIVSQYGYTEIPNADGSKTVVHIMEGHPNMAIVSTEYKDGKRVFSDKDGGETTIIGDRHTYKAPPPSKEVVDYHTKNGIAVRQYNDGRVEVEPMTGLQDWKELPNSPDGTKHFVGEGNSKLDVKPDGSYTQVYKDDHGREHTVHYDNKSGTMTDEYEDRVDYLKPRKNIVTTERDGKESTQTFHRDRENKDWVADR